MESKIDILYREIEQCLIEMQESYPELYHFLDEDSVFGNQDKKTISEAALKNYLESLRSEMTNYRELHELR